MKTARPAVGPEIQPVMPWCGKRVLDLLLAVTDKLTTGQPHFVEMGHSQPTCLQP